MLDWFVSTLWKVFILYSQGILVYCFLMLSLSCFRMSWGYFLFFYFWKDFVRNWCSFSFKYMVEFTSKAIWSWTFLWENFFITNSVSLFVIDLFRCSISSWVSFGRVFFSLEMCPFHYNFLIYWHVIVHGLTIFLHVCKVSSEVPSFISDFIILSLLSFFSSSV